MDEARREYWEAREKAISTCAQAMRQTYDYYTAAVRSDPACTAHYIHVYNADLANARNACDAALLAADVAWKERESHDEGRE